MVDMRLHPIAVIPLILAFAALIMASSATGLLLPLTVGVAAATFLVALAVVYHYVTPPTVPAEIFSAWGDVGRPAAGLSRISPEDIGAAARIAGEDLRSISINAELLRSRLSLLMSRHGFERLMQKKLDRLAENLLQDLQAAVGRLSAGRWLSSRALRSIERCASQADRVANELYDFQRWKPEIILAQVDPLRRGAKRLSLDLKFAFANISKFVEKIRRSKIS